MEGNASVSFDVIKFMECTNFAAIKHQSQRRKDPDKTPYINHPIGCFQFFKPFLEFKYNSEQHFRRRTFPYIQSKYH